MTEPIYRGGQPLTEVDCGDNSCMFRDHTKRGGMRTNGGCRCFDLIPTSRFMPERSKLRIIAGQLRRLRDEVKRLRSEAWACSEPHSGDGDYAEANANSLMAQLAEGRSHE